MPLENFNARQVQEIESVTGFIHKARCGERYGMSGGLSPMSAADN